MREYSNSKMREAINEYVHDERYRRLFILIFCDGMTYEQAAERVSFSPQHVKKLVKDYREYLFRHL